MHRFLIGFNLQCMPTQNSVSLSVPHVEQLDLLVSFGLNYTEPGDCSQVNMLYDGGLVIKVEVIFFFLGQWVGVFFFLKQLKLRWI